jgi:hypothetical protein
MYGREFLKDFRLVNRARGNLSWYVTASEFDAMKAELNSLDNMSEFEKLQSWWKR